MGSMISFEVKKQHFLSKPDKSRKGSIDEKIKALVSYINTLPDYYTTSSCSGRILVLERKQKKHETIWHYATHDLVDNNKKDSNELIAVMNKYKENDNIMFHFEDAILHVACASLESAEHLLQCARSCSFKSSGIISIHNKIVEIRSPKCIDVPVCCVTNEHLLIEKANDKLSQSWDKINALKELLEKKE